MQSRYLIAVSYIVSTTLLVVFLLVTSDHGVGISTDSVLYARAAESLQYNGNLLVPLTSWDSQSKYAPLSHFPPLQAVLLAIVGKLFITDPFTAARWLNAACIFATSFFLLLPASTNWLSFLVLLTILVGPSFLYVHLWLWSEPLFLCVSVIAFRTGVNALTEPRSAGRIITLAALCGLATLIRYAGVFLFFGFVTLLLVSSVDVRTKLRQLVLYMGVYAAIQLPWFLWILAVGKPARSVGLYGANVWTSIINDLLATIVQWFIPHRLPGIVKLLFFVGFALILVSVALKHRRLNNLNVRLAVQSSLTLCAAYLASIILARFFADSAIPFDERILSPALILLGIAFSYFAGAVLSRPIHVKLGAILLICVVIGNMIRTAPHLQQAAKNGNGYARDEWRYSETIAWLGQLPQNVTIFSNGADGICALLRVPAKYTPSAREFFRLPEFQMRLEQANPAVLILFDDVHKNWLLSKDKIVSGRNVKVRLFRDSIVMGWGLDVFNSQVVRTSLDGGFRLVSGYE